VLRECIAGNYGTRKRSGGVSTLICAVLDDRNADDDEPRSEVSSWWAPLSNAKLSSRYSSFVRIGTGLTFADYMWTRQKPWKEWDPKNPPEFLHTAKRGHEDKGDVYIEPAEYVAHCLCPFYCPNNVLVVHLY
jgi:DNA ligase 4